MALSGSHTGTAVGGLSLRIDWSATQSISNNTSTITAKAYVVIASGWSIQIGSRTGVINIDGTNYTITYNLGSKGAGTYQIGTASKTVSHHKTTGEKSFAISGNAKIEATITGYGWIGTLYKGSNTYTLDPITRASKPTLNYSTRDIGSSITISTNRASGSSFTHTLTYSFGTQSGTIATGVTTSQAWTLPASLASAIPNSRSGVGTITCTTYNGSNVIGSNSVPFTAIVPDNSTFRPTASIDDIVENGVIPSGITVFVQNHSKLKVISGGSGEYSATIKTYSVTVANIGTYTGSVITSDFLRNSGSVRVTLTVTDSRGLKGSTYQDISVIAYSPPQITFSAVRNAVNPANIEVSFEGSITPINNQNYKYFRIRSKESDASDNSYVKETDSSQHYAFGGTQIVTSNPDKSYTIEVFVQDSFNSITRTLQVGTAFTLMDFHEDGRDMAIGKVSEGNGFEVGMPTTIFTTEATVLTLKRSSPFANVTLAFENDVQSRYMSFSSEGRPRWNTTNDVNHTDGFDFWTQENSMAMVDWGSNANGRYIRFDDGTMICSLNHVLSNVVVTNAQGGIYGTTTSYTWTFPATFSAFPSVSGLCTASSGGYTFVSASTINSNSNMGYNIARTLSGTIPAVRVGLMAVGRWK